MNVITPDNIVEELLRSVPEVQPQFQLHQDFIEEDPDDVPVYIILGCVLNPYLWPILDSDRDEEPLQRIYAFAERVATSGSAYLENAIAIEICEPLLGKTGAKWRAKAWPYMGEATKMMYNDMETWWEQHRVERKSKAEGQPSEE